LKQQRSKILNTSKTLLIAPKGIETRIEGIKSYSEKQLLIAPKGIETYEPIVGVFLLNLLIAPKGIETFLN